MAQIRIFDVAHGFFACITADDGAITLVDCGHNGSTGFYPSHYLSACGYRGIHRLFITNYDEDHLSGLPHLRRNESKLPIQWLHRNRSIEYEQLAAVKRRSGSLGPGIVAILEMIANYTVDELPSPLEPPNAIEFVTFHNDYPEFDDTNNLSLVLFLRHRGVTIVFSGDLERAGWGRLLQNQSFRYQLSRVNIFVASHHGRQSGYLPEIFECCTPQVIVISDEAMQFDTQEHCYGKHANGIVWNGNDQRRVLTTRCDGDLVISTNTDRGYHIQASR